MLKGYFEQYMKVTRRLSDSSVKHYIGGISTINLILDKYNFPIRDLFEVHTLEELYAVKNFVFSNEEFINKNIKGKRMYSAAFNNFFGFACESEIWSEQELSNMDIILPRPKMVNSNGSFKWQRNSIIVSQVIKSAHYCCEYDITHKTFTSKKTGENYVEGHHLVPLQNQEHFTNSLDVYANIISLCPICHCLLHRGVQNERKYVLEKVFDDRKQRLQNSGINLTVRDLFKIIG